MKKSKKENDDEGLRLRLRDLQVFITAVECASMRKAANQLKMSQPSVTQMIKKLENTFGVPLIERTRSGIEPTVYGKALLKRGFVAFDELNQTVNDIKSLSDATTGDVRFCAPQGVGSVIFANAVAEFIRSNPKASVYVSVETSLQETLAKLRKRYCDFVIGALPMPLRSNLEIDDLKIDRVLNDEIVLVAGKEHHLRKHQTVKLAQIVNERWIMPPKEEWYHGWLIKLFREEGLILPAPSVVTSSAPVVARLINEDKFVAIRSRLFARYHGLLELKCPLPNTKFSWSIITIRGRTLSPIVERFIEFSRDSLKAAGKSMGIAA